MKRIKRIKRFIYLKRNGISNPWKVSGSPFHYRVALMILNKEKRQKGK